MAITQSAISNVGKLLFNDYIYNNHSKENSCGTKRENRKHFLDNLANVHTKNNLLGANLLIRTVYKEE